MSNHFKGWNATIVGTCQICEVTSPVISDALGLCSDCISRHPEQTRKIALGVHARSRKWWALPGSPPRDPEGIVCNFVCGPMSHPKGRMRVLWSGTQYGRQNEWCQFWVGKFIMVLWSAAYQLRWGLGLCGWYGMRFSTICQLWGAGIRLWKPGNLETKPTNIQRALDAWSEIELTDDQDNCLSTATVHRNVKTSLKFFIKEWLCQTYQKFLRWMISWLECMVSQVLKVAPGQVLS